MNDDELNQLVEGLGDHVNAKLPLNVPFAIVCWNPETQCTHVWVPNKIHSDSVPELLESGIEAIKDPHRVIGGN